MSVRSVFKSASVVVSVLAMQLTLVAGGAEQVLTRPDARTIVGPKNYLTGYPSQNADGTINVVVEIPAGSNQKWEVAKSDGTLRWEIKDNRPRIVSYLAYPANYGMVPRTLLSKELGGDGDPLDVVVLGQALPRGSIVPVRLIGVLRMLDRGEQDDKLIGVPADGPLSGVTSLKDLYKRFPGITSILEIWFANYKGPGKIVTLGFDNAREAESVLRSTASEFEKRTADGNQ